MLAAILATLVAVDCGSATDAASAKRQYDCIARALAGRRSFRAKIDAWSPGIYEGDANGTVRLQGKVIYRATGETPPMRVGGYVTAPVLPKEVRRRVDNPVGISGIVIVEAVIDRDGRVASTRILKPLPYGFDKRADEVVQSLRFEPGRFFGQKVPVSYNISVRVSGEELVVTATPARPLQ